MALKFGDVIYGAGCIPIYTTTTAVPTGASMTMATTSLTDIERADYLQQIHGLSVALHVLHSSNAELENDKRELMKQLECCRILTIEHTVKIDCLQRQNVELEKKIADISLRFSKLEELYKEKDNEHTKMKHYIEARDVASKVDTKAMNFVFPDCLKKPFCLHSFANLLSFLATPTSDVFAGPLAHQAWNALSEEDKRNIQRRCSIIQKRFEYLKVYVRDLKHEGNRIAHKATSIDELREFFDTNGESGLLEALNGCVQFLDYDFGTVDLSSEVDYTKLKNKLKHGLLIPI